MEAIIRAILNSNVDLVKNLLNNEINKASSYWYEVFNVMLEVKKIKNVFLDQRREFVEFLLDNGADKIKTDRGLCQIGLCFFLFTCKFVSHNIVRLIIKYGPDFKCEDKWDLIEILKAFRAGDVEIYNLLLDSGIDASDINNLYLLHYYVESKSASEVVLNKFFRLGANVNATNELGESVLYVAAGAGNLDVVKLLIEKKADVNYLGGSGNTKTALNGALSNGNKEIVKYFLEQGADVNLGFSIIRAIKTRNLELVKLILDHGADINLSNGSRSLFCAATFGKHEKIVELLLNRGAKTDILTISKFFGSIPNVVQLLLERGFDPNGIDEQGRCPLFRALIYDNSYSLLHLRLLLIYWADVNIEFQGMTALQLSSLFSYKQPEGRSLVSHIVLMKSLNLFVSEKNLNVMKANKDLVEFGERCESELKLLEAEQFEESSFNCCDILTIRDSRKLASLANNENIAKVVESEDFKKKFPIYGDRIIKQFNRGNVEKKNFELFKRFIDYLSTRDHDRLPTLTFTVVSQIFTYLNKNDIGNLRDL